MLIREVVIQKDWDILHHFWRLRGMMEINPSHIPPTGLVAEREDGVLLCGAFLVKSDTAVASLAFVVGNPDVPKEERSDALDSVILALVEIAMKSGFSIVGVATNVPALQARYEKLGFAMTDENVKCYGGYI